MIFMIMGLNDFLILACGSQVKINVRFVFASTTDHRIQQNDRMTLNCIHELLSCNLP